MTIGSERIPTSGLDYVDTIALPPEALRHRVHGAADAESFLEIGRQCAQDIVAALECVGRAPESFEAVLDFGCGCGRVLRWLMPRFGSARLFGSDIDRQALAWCASNLPGGSFTLNAGLPPTGFATQSFDLIYAISVFSHLDEDFQFYWLNELRRIVRPGGIVLLSIHGSYYLGNLEEDIVAEVQARGMKFVVTSGWKNVFPDWYQVAFHTQDYVVKEFGQYFELLNYLPGGMNGVQDLVVLRRRSGRESALDRELGLQGETSRLRSHITVLEQAIAVKNAHIARLEQLIGAIESGRVMRVLRWATRRSGGE